MHNFTYVGSRYGEPLGYLFLGAIMLLIVVFRKKDRIALSVCLAISLIVVILNPPSSVGDPLVFGPFLFVVSLPQIREEKSLWKRGGTILAAMSVVLVFAYLAVAEMGGRQSLTLGPKRLLAQSTFEKHAEARNAVLVVSPAFSTFGSYEIDAPDGEVSHLDSNDVFYAGGMRFVSGTDVAKEIARWVDVPPLIERRDVVIEPNMTLDQLRSKAGFPLTLPTPLPKGLFFADARCALETVPADDPNALGATYKVALIEFLDKHANTLDLFETPTGKFIPDFAIAILAADAGEPGMGDYFTSGNMHMGIRARGFDDGSIEELKRSLSPANPPRGIAASYQLNPK